MKVGFYKDDLVGVVEGFGDEFERCASSYVENGDFKAVAQSFADEFYEIYEDSDMNFNVYVELEGNLYEFSMFTEYDPRFEIED